MKLSEMKQVLAAGDIQLTKSLGQNFLHDANQLRRIVEAAELKPSDRVLEIGPGLGPLTELLLEQAGRVLAIEKDLRLVQVLQRRFGTVPHEPHPEQAHAGTAAGVRPSSGAASLEPAGAVDQTGTAPLAHIAAPEDGRTPPPVGAGGPAALELMHADALDYLKAARRDWGEWKLVANLPYSVASPILVELAQAQRPPRRMVATLQIEVARRLMAKRGEEDYGLLTLLVQLAYEPLAWFKIPAGCFFPEPVVDSACVCLARREQPLLPAEGCAAFGKIVKRAFSQRRKMMRKLLKADWPEEPLQRAFAEARISPQARAESLSLEQFVQLTQSLSGAGTQPKTNERRDF